MTGAPLLLSHDPGLNWLVGVEYGQVLDGKPRGEYVAIDEECAYARRHADGPIIGFVVNEYRAYDIADHPEQWEGPRFDVPVLGLIQASVNEIVVSTRATIGNLATADVALFDNAVEHQEGEDGVLAWQACLTTGNMKAHFGLGYTLWEAGRFREAYRHLRFYTEIAPHNAWAWCWLGRASVSIDELSEARSAFKRALELEADGGFETDAEDLLSELPG